MKIAVIPARGGSKRIPRKNIKVFNNKPMILWALNTAKESGIFDHIIVSSDDKEIIEISKEFGAEVPFIRPKEISDDITPTVPVISHALKECINLGWSVEYACCIYPCVPFLKSSDLVNSFEILKNQEAEFVYPVVEYAHPIQRAMRKLSSGQMQFLDASNEMTRTQDLEKTYHDAGQFYWGKKDAWINEKKMHSDGVGMPIENWRVVDIDNHDDWKRAEILYKLISLD